MVDLVARKLLYGQLALYGMGKKKELKRRMMQWLCTFYLLRIIGTTCAFDGKKGLAYTKAKSKEDEKGNGIRKEEKSTKDKRKHMY